MYIENDAGARVLRLLECGENHEAKNSDLWLMEELKA